MRMPLPYSAFPDDLAHHVGAMTVAYQRVEEEVLGLIRSVTHVEPEILDVFLSRNWQISARLQILKDLSTLCLDDVAEASRVNKLADSIDKIGKQRNEFMHSATHGFNKQTGEILQLNRKKKKAEAKWLRKEDLEILINRMYLILEALDQRHNDVDDWDQPLGFWDAPATFWKTD
jgi:hypothetical protein